MSTLKTVYVSIGNSDDKLTQTEWARFQTEVLEVISETATQIFGVWHSGPRSQYQNMCVGFAFDPDHKVDLVFGETANAHLHESLDRIRAYFKQRSIAWAEVQTTEFIGDDDE